jgi:16S rRNA (cytosine1402-N4)-methyltransferase
MHQTVLLHETIAGLGIKEGDVLLDGTVNAAGHSKEACQIAGGKITIIGLDMDEDALVRAEENLKAAGCDHKLMLSSFRNMDKVLIELGIKAVDKIILDLGLSSNQFEESGRGFTFQRNEPLLMTFKKNPTVHDLTAKEIVNTWDEENIEAILKGYGEERYARKIARAIVEHREVKPINTTFELVEIIKDATPKTYHFRKIHPATKTFQALRITVNDEIESLKDGLKKGFEALASDGRMAVISFHSLEDRAVKHYFKDLEKVGLAKMLTKKPITPSDAEVQKNSRSRSAKLRILQKN